jgi:ABC-type lipoprotein release transport system permease subunit
MKNYKIAWRNLWRNKRRTLITVASVFFAVFFALLMRSLQLGSYDHMFRNVIESYTGYVQIQNEDFWDDKTVDNVFEYSPELEKVVLDDENATAVVPRFESFALASIGTITKGVLVMGIDPVAENLLSDVKGKLVKYRLTEEAIASLKKSDLPAKIKNELDLFKDKSYSGDGSLQADLGIKEQDADDILPSFAEYASFSNGYFEKGEQGALIGDRLSRYLKLNIGDTIVLISQGYHATTAAAKFRVSGIIKLPTPDLDNMIVYLPYDVCQEFYNAPGMLTSLAIDAKNNDDKHIDAMIARLEEKLQSPLRVIGWREMNQLLINQMDADNKSGMIMIGILYLVIAFGIFGTVLMMTAERKREFGVVVAIGMQKTKLSLVMIIEMIYIGLMGIMSGVVIALPAILIGVYNPIRFSGEMAKMYEDYGMEPIMPFMPVDSYFLWQSLIVAIIVLIAIIYPVNKILKLNTANSLKA